MPISLMEMADHLHVKLKMAFAAIKKAEMSFEETESIPTAIMNEMMVTL